MKTSTHPSRVVDLGFAVARVEAEHGKTKLTLMAPADHLEFRGPESAFALMTAQQVEELIQALQSTLPAQSLRAV
jgi:hypothetical protein